MPVDSKRLPRFPRLRAHLKALPRGLESYPECKAKGTLVRTFAEGLDAQLVGAAKLPGEVESLLLSPPAPHVWFPEVLSWAGIFAAADLLAFPDDAAWEAWAHQRHLKLHGSPAMRAAMNFTSPNLALSLGSAYWGLLHQGSYLQLVDSQRRTALVALTCPEGLFGPAAARSLCVSFAVVLELARARRPVVQVEEHTATRVLFAARWS